jgi:hypothetical protein
MHSRLRAAVTSFSLAAVAMATIVVVPVSVASAANPPAFTLTTNTNRATNGTVLNLTTTQPILQAGSTTNTIVDHIDPTKIHLSDPSQIVAPSGWTVSYSTDGSIYSTSTPSDWSQVAWVKATGPVVATGVNHGRVVAQATDTEQAPSIAAIGAGGSGGDGYDVAIAANGDIFNMYHHDGAWQSGFMSGKLDCHSRATGAECAGNWPFAITDLSNPSAMHTATRAYEWIDNVHHHVWFPTSNSSGTGFGCIDISNEANPAWCGGSLSSAFILAKAGDYTGRDSNNGFAAVGTRLFTFSVVGGVVDCVDTAANSGAGGLCTNQPFSLGISGQPTDSVASMTNINGKVMGVDNGKVFCLDPSTLSACSGWTSWPTASFATRNGGANTSTIFPEPASDGTTAGMCIYSQGMWVSAVNPIECYSTAGSSLTPDSGLATAITTKVTAGNATVYAKPYQQLGSKLFFNNDFPSGNAWCYDVSTENWCTGWTADGANTDWTMYTVTLDPTNSSCLWTNGDGNGIGVINTTTGQAGCPAQGPSTVTFNDSVIIPRLSCSGSSIFSWSNFHLTEPTLGAGAGAASATLTVNDSSGNPISGWTNLPIPNSGIVNLSALSTVDTGQTPTLTVNFTGRDPSSINTTALLSASSDQPQLCIHPTVSSCPTNVSGIIPAQPAGVTLVTATGTIQAGSDPATTSGPSNVTERFAAAAQGTCGSSIVGTATRSGGGPVAGAKVLLWDEDNNVPVLFHGQPVTTTTAADGTYSFTGLSNGYFAPEFFNLDAQTTALSFSIPAQGFTDVPAGGKTMLTYPAIFGPTPATLEIDATYTGPATPAPGPPAGVTATTGATSAQVSWTPPANDGGSPVTSYTVYAGPSGQSCTYNVGDTPANTCLITGLPTFESETFTVVATTAAANSIESAPYTAEIGGFGLGQTNLQLELLQGAVSTSTDLQNWTPLANLGANAASANALAFNPWDGFAYALANNQNGGRQLLRIASDGQTEVAGIITNQVGQLTAGAIDPATGKYYVTAAGTQLYQVVQTSAHKFRLVSVPTPLGLWIGADFTISNGVLTTIGQRQIFQWTMSQPNTIVQGKPLNLGRNLSVGAMWTDPTDGIDFRLNNTMTIYHVSNLSSSNPTVSVVATNNGTTATSVDGTTVVPREGSPG